MFGPSESLYQSNKTWQLNVSFRALNSNKHYRGTHYEESRELLGNNVYNKQRMLDVGLTYAVNHRLNVSLSVPVVMSSWSIPLPVNPPGQRWQQDGRGIGDIIVTGRYWLLSTENVDRNVSAGLGVKMPTGNAYVTDIYPDITGRNPSRKAVDISAQPGDGGWGALLDVQGFQRVKRLAFFGGATYLVNPKNQNNTPSILVGLGRGSDPQFRDMLVNSVPDQYLVRGGVSTPVPRMRGLSTSVALRLEGVPVHDLIGGSHGWRRPGREAFLELGALYAKGNYAVNFNVPIAFYRNRLPNPYSGFAGDATFPDYIFLAGFSYRFKK